MADGQASLDRDKASRIPVVDLFKCAEESSPEQRLATAKQLVNACRQVGFVYIVNHGVAPNLVAEAFSWPKKLFDLKHEDKMKAPHPDGSAVHRGYSYLGLEKVSQMLADSGVSRNGDKGVHKWLRQISDYKVCLGLPIYLSLNSLYHFTGQALEYLANMIQESYEIGSEDNADQPNIWLPEDVLPGFRTFMIKFYWECHEAARKILGTLALGIGVSDEALLSFHTGLNNQLRLLHYPSIPAEELESERMARMPAHSDWRYVFALSQCPPSAH